MVGWQLIALPTALESPYALRLPFRGARTCGLDAVRSRTEFMRCDVSDYRCLASCVRGIPCAPAEVSGRAHGVAAQ